jgi:hypothetical protein
MEGQDMPTSFHVDAGSKVVFAVTRGETSSEEITGSLASLIDHPGYSPGMRVLLDMSDVVPSLHRPDIMEIARFVEENKGRIGDLKMAVVAPKDASFGMAQEQKVELEGSRIDMEVFRSVSEAREWLELGPEQTG